MTDAIEQNQPVYSIEKIYVKDLSLEIPNAPQIFLEREAPNVDVQLHHSSVKVDEGVFQTELTLTVTAKIGVKVNPGFHVNSNAPLDEYLIPLRLTWQAAPLELSGTRFPPAKQEKSEFSPKPIAVFDGTFEIASKFTIPAAAPIGAGFITGKLRYQGCNATTCFPPKTVDVRFSYDLH